MKKTIIIIALLINSLLIAGRAADTAAGQANSMGAFKEAAAMPLSSRNSLEDKFRMALIEEETGQQLDPAIQAYKEVIAALDEQRKMAVTAIFTLGECYRKQGKTNEAVMQYERILRDFSEQKTVVDLAQRRCAELSPNKSRKGTPLVSGSVVPKTFDPAQVKTIRDEIKLVEKQLLEVQKRLENGRATTSELYKPQQDLFVLERQLPENADPANQKLLIEQQMKLLEKQKEEVRKKIMVGAATSIDAIPIEREMLGLERELLSVTQQGF